MYISIHGNVYTGMPQDFAQAFDIEAKLYTPRGKCMSQCMKVYRSQTTLPLYITEIILHGTWFYIFFIRRCKNIPLTIGKLPLDELYKIIRNRNCTDWTFAFWWCDYNMRLLGSRSRNLQSLHCFMHINGFLLKWNIFPYFFQIYLHKDICKGFPVRNVRWLQYLAQSVG